MTKEDLEAIEEQNFREFKERVDADEKAGILDQIVGRVRELLAEVDTDVLERGPIESVKCVRSSSVSREEARHDRWQASR